MHSSLKPSYHIAEAVKTANRALGTLLRCLTYRDKYHYIHLYKMYVRCHLETAVQAWNPWTKHDIDNIESVQKRALRNCHGLNSSSYEERLLEVGLTSLIDRRGRGDMLQTFKILNGIDNVDCHGSRRWMNNIRLPDKLLVLPMMDRCLVPRTSSNQRRSWMWGKTSLVVAWLILGTISPTQSGNQAL